MGRWGKTHQHWQAPLTQLHDACHPRLESPQQLLCGQCRYSPRMLTADVNGFALEFPVPQLASLYSIRQEGQGLSAEAGLGVSEDCACRLEHTLLQMCERHPPSLINGQRIIELCVGGEPADALE